MSVRDVARDKLGAAGLDRAQGNHVGPVRAATAAVIAGGTAGVVVYRLLRGGESNESEEG
jgi:hypothetical protein